MINRSDSPGRVLITGAARRIGRAIALGLAQEGWQVLAHYHRSKDDAESLVEEIKGQGGACTLMQADLSSPGVAEKLIPNTIEECGPLTALVNNASLFENDDIQTLDEQSWDNHFTMNVKAPVFLAQAFAKHLPHGMSGNIINIIDQRVFKPAPVFFSYTLSKSALWEATRMLAQALAPRIRVNGIGPGPTLQSIHQSASQFKKQQATTLLEHGVTPDEIAAAVRFILECPSLTGQMIALDGGQHLTWKTSDIE